MAESTAAMRSRPLVSVVIPSHNYAHYVSDAIESVLAQTYAPVEIVVVDDGSTDDTPVVLARFGDRIRTQRLPGRGVAEARNTGLRACLGDLIVFLDADDLLLPDGIATLVAAFERHPDVDVVHGQWYHCNIRTGGVQLVGKPEMAGDAVAPLAHGNLGAIHAIMTRRRALEEAGGFDPAVSYTADWDLWFGLALRGFRFGYVPRPVAVYRVHPDSMQMRFATSDRDILYTLDKYFGDPTFDPQLRSRRRQAYFGWRRYMGGLHLFYADTEGALVHYREALRLVPEAARSVDFYFGIARTMWRRQVRIEGVDPEVVAERALEFTWRVAAGDGRNGAESAVARLGVGLMLMVAGRRRRAMEQVAAAASTSMRAVLSRSGLRILARGALPAVLAERVLDGSQGRIGGTAERLPPLVQKIMTPAQARSSGR